MIFSLSLCISTKDRRKIIDPEAQTSLSSYMGGIACTHEMKALAIGGTEDHVHLLLSLPSTKAIAKAMNGIKSGSTQMGSRSLPTFAWQEGYGAFSIGTTQIESTCRYISSQIEHHKKHDFQGEVLALLKKHRIDYDLRYIWN